MATICATPFKVPRIRATLLNSCGDVVENCSTVVSDGVITVEIAREYEDREEFFKKNGDGVFCVKETDPMILKWINLTMTFCGVDPQLVNFLAGETVIEDNATPPNVIGFRNSEGSSALVNAGVEVWTRTTGNPCVEGAPAPRYGYLLFPWFVEGTIGDLTLENGAADFVLSGRTKSGGNWGVGPYTVQHSQAAVNLGDPIPLLSPVAPTDHELWLWSTLAPPLAACGCVEMPLDLVAVDSGVLTATVTIPTGTLPAIVDWGDASATETVTVGPTVNHVYAAPGTYLIRLWPMNFSSAAYQISLAVA